MAKNKDGVNFIYQGESYPQIIELQDASGAVNINNTYSGILVHVLDQDDTVKARYSWKAFTGYNSDDFEVLNQVTNIGQFQINIQRDITLELEGDIYFEVKTQIDTSGWTDNEFLTEFTITQDENGDIWRVVNNKTKNKTSFG